MVEVAQLPLDIGMRIAPPKARWLEYALRGVMAKRTPAEAGKQIDAMIWRSAHGLLMTVPPFALTAKARAMRAFGPTLPETPEDLENHGLLQEAFSKNFPRDVSLKLVYSGRSAGRNAALARGEFRPSDFDEFERQMERQHSDAWWGNLALNPLCPQPLGDKLYERVVHAPGWEGAASRMQLTTPFVESQISAALGGLTLQVTSPKALSRLEALVANPSVSRACLEMLTVDEQVRAFPDLLARVLAHPKMPVAYSHALVLSALRDGPAATEKGVRIWSDDRAWALTIVHALSHPSSSIDDRINVFADERINGILGGEDGVNWEALRVWRDPRVSVLVPEGVTLVPDRDDEATAYALDQVRMSRVLTLGRKGNLRLPESSEVLMSWSALAGRTTNGVARLPLIPRSDLAYTTPSRRQKKLINPSVPKVTFLAPSDVISGTNTARRISVKQISAPGVASVLRQTRSRWKKRVSVDLVEFNEAMADAQSLARSRDVVTLTLQVPQISGPTRSYLGFWRVDCDPTSGISRSPEFVELFSLNESFPGFMRGSYDPEYVAAASREPTQRLRPSQDVATSAVDPNELAVHELSMQIGWMADNVPSYGGTRHAHENCGTCKLDVMRLKTAESIGIKNMTLTSRRERITRARSPQYRHVETRMAEMIAAMRDSLTTMRDGASPDTVGQELLGPLT